MLGWGTSHPLTACRRGEKAASCEEEGNGYDENETRDFMSCPTAPGSRWGKAEDLADLTGLGKRTF